MSAPRDKAIEALQDARGWLAALISECPEPTDETHIAATISRVDEAIRLLASEPEGERGGEIAWHSRAAHLAEICAARSEDTLTATLRELFGTSLNEMAAKNLPFEWSSDSAMGRSYAILSLEPGECSTCAGSREIDLRLGGQATSSVIPCPDCAPQADAAKVGEPRAMKFRVGAWVQKTSGYKFVGVVLVAYYPNHYTEYGDERDEHYVVENGDGLQNIFNGTQLKLQPGIIQPAFAPPAAATDAELVEVAIKEWFGHGYQDGRILGVSGALEHEMRTRMQAVVSLIEQAAKAEERKACIADVRAEEELDGSIPDAVIEAFRGVGPEEACRSIVRVTKTGIETRIRQRGAPGRGG